MFSTGVELWSSKSFPLRSTVCFTLIAGSKPAVLHQDAGGFTGMISEAATGGMIVFFPLKRAADRHLSAVDYPASARA